MVGKYGGTLSKAKRMVKIDPKLSTIKRGVQIMPCSSSSWKGCFHGYHIHHAYISGRYKVLEKLIYK